MLVKQGDHSKTPELIQTNGRRSLLIIGFPIFTVYTFTVLGTAFWLSVHTVFLLYCLDLSGLLVWGCFLGGILFFFFLPIAAGGYALDWTELPGCHKQQ